MTNSDIDASNVVKSGIKLNKGFSNKDDIVFDTVEEHSTSATTKKHSWFSKVFGDIHAEDDDPKSYTQAKKNMIILIVALSGINGPFATLIYMPGILQMQKDLNTSLHAIDATMSAYIVFAGIAPLFWSSMSDAYGRKPMYMFSVALGAIASVLCGLSQNVAMLIVFRAIQACGASSGQTLGAGVIADTIDVAHRGKAYGIFYIGPLLGPVIGPTIGGVLCEFLGWQSTFYFVAIFGFCLFLMITFLLPETVRKKRVEQPYTNSKGLKAFTSIRNAFIPMISMLRDPTICITTLYGTVIFASLFFLNPTLTDTFESLYGYNSWQIGLCYLCFGIGLMCGSILSGIYADYVIRSLRSKSNTIYPEMRLKAVYPSFILIPLGYLTYAWTAEKQVGVYGPLIGLFIYALGQMCAINPASVYLVDSKPGRSASAVAINNCVRSLIAAVVTLFSTQCVRLAGPGIVFTVLAGISIINIVPVLLVKAYGQAWRTNFEKKAEAAKLPNKEVV